MENKSQILHNGTFQPCEKSGIRFSVVFVSALYEGATGLQRLRAIQELGHEVFPINTSPMDVAEREHRFDQRILSKIMGSQDLAQVNKQILECVHKNKIDMIWLDKALTVERETLQIVRQINPGCFILGYSPDDMAAKHCQSRQFLQHLSEYDVFFTTKSFGVRELKDLGCQRVEFIENAFDPHTHRPMKITEEIRKQFGGPVGFVGTYEKERAESMLFLALQGIPVRIWGRWDRCRIKHPNLKIENIPLYGDAYATVLNAFDINLHFLRKINRDLQTTRSIEIPACGSFMLAERSNEHLALFSEGKESEFFSSNEELLNKVRHYLVNPKERATIATAGRERCLNSGYSNKERIGKIFELIIPLRKF